LIAHPMRLQSRKILHGMQKLVLTLRDFSES